MNTPDHKPRNHIKAWRVNGKINYKAIADNGESLFPSGNQQFSTRTNFIKSLIAIGKMFNTKGVTLSIVWVKSARSNKAIKKESFTING